MLVTGYYGDGTLYNFFHFFVKYIFDSFVVFYALCTDNSFLVLPL